MKLTIRDIARKAGVSHTTVSMVLNEDSRITAETRDKVMKLVRQFNFHPNAAARGLAKGKSNVISIVSVMLASPFISAVLEGIEQQAYDLGRYEYALEMLSTRKSPMIKKDLLEEILYSRQSRAIILLGIKPSENITEDFRRRGIPIVTVEQRTKGAHSVVADNFSGAYMAAEYLIKQGRKRIGLITAGLEEIKKDEEVYTSARERYEGFIKALKDNGIRHYPELVTFARRFSYEEGGEALEAYAGMKVRPDAVFCAAGDTTALGFMEQAAKKRISIPKDTALIGYDDLMFSRFVRPGLTTIAQPIAQMGREAMNIIVQAVDGKLKKEKHKVFRPELVIRQTA